MAKPDNLVLSRLSRNAPTAFDLAPDAAARAALAEALNLSDLRKLRLRGNLHPEGRRDWRLEAHLGATVVQPCAVTLDPVTTRIEEDIIRRYLEDMPEIGTADEVEMSDDDSLEPLPVKVDLDAVLAETLALALPLFPRAPGAELDRISAAPPGVAPLREEDTKPLTGLAALRDRMKRAGPDDDSGENGPGGPR